MLNEVLCTTIYYEFKSIKEGGDPSILFSASGSLSGKLALRGYRFVREMQIARLREKKKGGKLMRLFPQFTPFPLFAISPFHRPS